MLDRAYGCLVGGAIGDALGAPVEGASRDDIKVSDFVTDAPIGTDDTDYQVTDEAKTRALDDLAGEPAGDQTNQQYDNETFIRHVHGGAPLGGLFSVHLAVAG